MPEEVNRILTDRISDLLLTQGKLSVCLAEPLIVIKKLAPGVRGVNKRFGPLKNIDDTNALRALYDQNSTRGA
jgi:hypothetical protein